MAGNTSLIVGNHYRRSQGMQGGADAPQGDEKKFSRHFCWNEAKIGLNLVRCTPAEKVVDGSIVYDVREGDD